MSNCVNMESRAITILSFEIFKQRVFNTIRIAIPGHERFDDFNLIIEKCFQTANFKS